MKIKYILLTAALLLTLLQVLPADQRQPIAILFKVRGKVFIKTQKQIRAKRGMRIYDGTKIITKKRSFAAIKFIDDGSLVRVRSNSTCTFNGKRRQNSLAKNIFVEVGTLFSKISGLKGSFRVSTPTSVASVKGTAFWTKQEFKGGTYYFGEEGVVEIKNKSGSALLHSGETGFVSSPGSKPIVRKSKPGERPKTAADNSRTDELELEFQNKDGQTKTLKFKVKMNSK